MRRMGGDDGGQALVEFILVFAFVGLIVAGLLGVRPRLADTTRNGTATTVCRVLGQCGGDRVGTGGQASPAGLAPPAAQEAAGVRAAVVDAARGYLGTGYELGFGPASCPMPNGKIDCECLNRLAYSEGAGIQLGHTLSGQIAQGTVTTSPQPGDLVFFDMNGDGDYGDDLDHTGIYTGNGMYANANSEGVGTIEQPVSDTSNYAGTPPLYVDILTPRS
jgi:cell wall-associated NlpC family hydrolase